MNNVTLAFMGGGNIATSLIGGLLETGVAAEQIRVCDVQPEPIARRFAVACFAEVGAAVRGADVVVLAVKPQQMSEAVQSLTGYLGEWERLPLFISVAAGIRVASIEGWLGFDCPVPIVRAMPNTPALLRCSATALFAGEFVDAEQRQLAENILRAVGLTVWLEDEGLMDVVTAVSGSGPAYFFLLMELLEKAGKELGLPAEVARLLTLQTALGAAKMAIESEVEPAVLRENVTSRGGTTEHALHILQSGGLEGLWSSAIEAAAQRAAVLAQQYGDKV